MLEASSYAGRVWRHTDKLSTRTGEWLYCQELGVSWQTLGKKAWHTWHRFPAMGLSGFYIRLGEGNHGQAWGFLPHLDLPLWRRQRLVLDCRIGTGIARVQKPFNAFRNPEQNAIGSHWNNLTQFRVGARFRLNRRLILQAGISLTHLSNGSYALPNFGINLPAMYIGMLLAPAPIQAAATQENLPRPDRYRRWRAQLQLGHAVVEYNAFDGPKYAIWRASAAGVFRLNRANQCLGGLDYEFNRAVLAWGKHTQDFSDPKAARRGATRIGFFLADEFLFGHFGIQVQKGWYAGRGFNAYALRPSYNKLTLRYYWKPIKNTAPALHVGVTLKSHAAVAEYIAWNIGCLL